MKFKLKGNTLILTFALLLGLYILYYKKLPPFTTENLAKLEDYFEDFTGPGKGSVYDNLSQQTLNPKDQQPKTQLKYGNLQPPKAKTDPKISEDFAKGVYQQLFLPYDRYPFLYSDDYIQTTRNTPSDIRQFPYNNPNGIVLGYRPPIQIGSGFDARYPYEEFLNPLYQYYGYYPPGGGGNYYYDDDHLDIHDLIQIGNSNYATAHYATEDMNNPQIANPYHFRIAEGIERYKYFPQPDDVRIKKVYMTKQEAYNRKNAGYRTMLPNGRIKTVAESLRKTIPISI